MASRIHLVIGGHLCMSPRGQKEAATLQEAGYEVRISGIWFDRRLAVIDRELMRRQKLRFAPAWDIREEGNHWRRFISRLEGRWARARFRRGIFAPTLLGYGTRQLLETCRRTPAELTIIHSEAGLWVGSELLREGRRVGVDFEDWFSRDLPPESRRDRPVAELARLENELLHRARYRLASSSAMACALAEEYRVDPPAVVTNAFPWEQRAPLDGRTKDRQGPSLSLHWFSQTIGPARGLELLFAALPLLRHPVQVSLRGACSPQNHRWLEAAIPEKMRHLITLLPPVEPWELPSRIAEHDLGLALETATIPSRDLCLSNKFFQYLQGGLAVIVTGTRGQREGMHPCPGAGTVLAEATPAALAAAIDAYAQEPPRLREARRCALAAATGPWNGARDGTTILTEAQRALA